MRAMECGQVGRARRAGRARHGGISCISNAAFLFSWENTAGAAILFLYYFICLLSLSFCSRSLG